MKRILINALCLAVIVTGSTALYAQDDTIGDETNYQTCMRICREDGHSFTYCHGECKGLADGDAAAEGSAQ